LSGGLTAVGYAAGCHSLHGKRAEAMHTKQRGTMKQQGWKGITPKGKQVTYTCHERTAGLADITAQVAGKESFQVHLDVPLPISREQVENRFATELNED
jgi:hypothetical protein